jgi:hypothetical protein
LKPNDILKAISRKYSDGALVKEIALNTEPSDPVSNLWKLEKAAYYYGEDSDYYKEVAEQLKGQEIAESIPLGWTPLPTQRRIDGLLYASSKLIAIEVKISVADFKRETEAKREPWERVTHQFVYATPKDLLSPSDIPDHCGLWEINANGSITITKRAKVNKTPESMPQQVLVALMYRNRLKSF